MRPIPTVARISAGASLFRDWATFICSGHLVTSVGSYFGNQKTETSNFGLLIGEMRGTIRRRGTALRWLKERYRIIGGCLIG